MRWRRRGCWRRCWLEGGRRGRQGRCWHRGRCCCTSRLQWGRGGRGGGRGERLGLLRPDLGARLAVVRGGDPAAARGDGARRAPLLPRAARARHHRRRHGGVQRRRGGEVQAPHRLRRLVPRRRGVVARRRRRGRGAGAAAALRRRLAPLQPAARRVARGDPRHHPPDGRGHGGAGRGRSRAGHRRPGHVQPVLPRGRRPGRRGADALLCRARLRVGLDRRPGEAHVAVLPAGGGGGGRRKLRAGKLDGPLPAKDKHLARLPRGLRRRPRLLAAVRLARVCAHVRPRRVCEADGAWRRAVRLGLRRRRRPAGRGGDREGHAHVRARVPQLPRRRRARARARLARVPAAAADAGGLPLLRHPAGDGDRDARGVLRQPAGLLGRGQDPQGAGRAAHPRVRNHARRRGLVPRLCHAHQAPHARRRPVATKDPRGGRGGDPPHGGLRRRAAPARGGAQCAARRRGRGRGCSFGHSLPRRLCRRLKPLAARRRGSCC
mmetsp:Transcript_29302/g.95402  ORF Transcript_29302/g.95402 Transcript_29302/m.95402 type:complete len:492 (-) Transcript_29302:26-1501(-)